tara:strand:- start:270 stop:623 length:354 start_codon:yes stop_codon:yes gene_type:complete
LKEGMRAHALKMETQKIVFHLDGTENYEFDRVQKWWRVYVPSQQTHHYFIKLRMVKKILERGLKENSPDRPSHVCRAKVDMDLSKGKPLLWKGKYHPADIPYKGFYNVNDNWELIPA